MRTNKKIKIMHFLMALLLAAMVGVPALAATEPTVNLGTTSTFAVMAGTTITNTGPTTVDGDEGGDVGLYPGSAFPGKADVTLSGTLHINDTVAIKATTDLVAAYDDAFSRPTTMDLTGEDPVSYTHLTLPTK